MLARPKFAKRIERAGVGVDELVETYAALAEQVTPADIPPTITADPDDDAVLAAAVGGQANLIVSGDADLLGLGSFRNVPILAAAAAVLIVRPAE